MATTYYKKYQSGLLLLLSIIGLFFLSTITTTIVNAEEDPSTILPTLAKSELIDAEITNILINTDTISVDAINAKLDEYITKKNNNDNDISDNNDNQQQYNNGSAVELVDNILRVQQDAIDLMIFLDNLATGLDHKLNKTITGIDYTQIEDINDNDQNQVIGVVKNDNDTNSKSNKPFSPSPRAPFGQKSGDDLSLLIDNNVDNVIDNTLPQTQQPSLTEIYQSANETLTYLEEHVQLQKEEQKKHQQHNDLDIVFDDDQNKQQQQQNANNDHGMIIAPEVFDLLMNELPPTQENIELLLQLHFALNHTAQRYKRVSMGVSALGDDFLGLLDRAVDVVGNIKDGVVDAAGSAVNLTKNAAGAVVDKASDLAGSAVNLTKNAAGAVVDTAGEYYDGAKNVVGNVVDAAKDKVGEYYDGAKNLVGNVVDGATGLAGSALNAVVGQLVDAFLPDLSGVFKAGGAIATLAVIWFLFF